MKRERWSPVLDDIADGMEMRLHLDMGISDTAIRETSLLAHRLGIPENNIRRWTKARKVRHGKIVHNMESLLRSLQNNATAQRVFCNFMSYDISRKPPGYENWKMN